MLVDDIGLHVEAGSAVAVRQGCRMENLASERMASEYLQKKLLGVRRFAVAFLAWAKSWCIFPISAYAE